MHIERRSSMKEEKHARARDGPPAVTPELEAKAFEEGLWMTGRPRREMQRLPPESLQAPQAIKKEPPMA